MLIDEKINELQNLIQRKITYEEIAKILGKKSGNVVRNWSYRQRHLQEFEIQKLDEAYCNKTPQNKTNNSDDKFINIPYWEHLPEHLKSLEVDYIPVQRKVIEVGWKLNPEALRIVPMVGDKMTKYWYQIGEDDLLIIDTAQNEILGNGVYFATSQNNTRFWVREMQNLINNDVQIKGYALSGETVKTFTRQQLADVDFKVIGKVIKNVSFRL